MDQPSDARLRVPFFTDELITAKLVAEITGLSRKRIADAAALGLLTVHRPPAGMRGMTRYGRRSAELLAASMITPATNPAPTEATDES